MTPLSDPQLLIGFMQPKHRTPTSPLELLQKEFLEPAGLSPDDLITPIREFFSGKRAIDTYLARVLAAFTGTTVQFWLNAEANYTKSLED